jgi:DNA-binding GntR family transcriptional regulator
MPRRIDPTADRAVYRQLADLIRDAINTGQLRPGELLPSEGRLAQVHEVGRDAVRDALALLRSEGQIVTERGVGSRVRDQTHTENVQLQRGDTVTTRMPTPEERRQLGIAEGVPVFVVRRGAGEMLHAGDRTRLEVHDQPADEA